MTLGWDQITQALDTVAREYGPETAAELAERLLMRYDDSRIVQILGDYANEQTPNTSIKGMLHQIVLLLRDIDDKLTDQHAELTAINSSTEMLAKYGELRSHANETYVRSKYGELRQSYRFKRVRQVQPPRYDPVYYPDGVLYEFYAPTPRIQSPDNRVVDQGLRGCHVRIAQNHQLGLSEYVYTSLVFTWYLDDQQVAPVVWYHQPTSVRNTMYLTLSAQPYIPVYVTDPRPETVQDYSSIDGGFGYFIYRQQLRYDAHDYLWLNVCMLVAQDDDPQVDWFTSGALQCQVDVYTGYINSLD